MTARLLLLLIATGMLSTVESWGQTHVLSPDFHNPNCAFESALERERQQPGFSSKQELVERQLYRQALAVIQRRQTSRSSDYKPSEILTIPLVIHVIHLSSEPNPGDGLSNPTDAQLLAGLEHLNGGFRNMETFAENGHNDHPAVQSVDTGIEFCLAQTDIYGQPTSGIIRYESDAFSELNADLEDPELQQWVDQQDAQAFPVTDYAHVWLVSKICRGTGTTNDPLNCSIGGYAYYPATSGSVYNGVVSLSYLWGTSAMNSKNHIHEFGHFLGLYHTFQGGCPNGDCLTNGDRVCDTPPDSRASFNRCGEPDNSCLTDADDTSANNPFKSDQDDLYENYMDYTSKSCQNTFTQGQAKRMRAVLLEVRNGLLNKAACAPPLGNTPRDCDQEELLLIEEEIASGTYENAEVIFASGAVRKNGSVSLHAAQGVTLLPGFRSERGTTLDVSLRDCPGNKKQPATSEKNTIPSSDQAFFRSTERQAAIKIAPNPVSSEARIEFFIPASTGPNGLALFDVNGRKVWEHLPADHWSGGWQQINLSVSDLPSGFYILQLRTEAEILSRQVVVN